MVNQLKSEAMKSIIYIGLLLLTLTSCQEDKGNYTYRNINEISVTGIAATKTVTQFSILGMSPVINQTMPVSADDLEYLVCRPGKWKNRYPVSRIEYTDTRKSVSRYI